MAEPARRRPSFSEEVERCIAAAKSIAAHESACPSLDSLHLIIAAVQTAPAVAQVVLERAGCTWKAAQDFCQRMSGGPQQDVTEKPMPLVEELGAVIYGQPHSTWQGRPTATVAVEEFLGVLLQKPTTRLQHFLRQIGQSGTVTGRKNAKASAGRPRSSFREYLVARKEVWALRGAAWRTICEHAMTGYEASGGRPTGPNHGDLESLLNRLGRLQEEHSCRVQATPLHRLANKNGLSALELELVEGALLHELYSSAPSFSVRELAQMTAPESYPRNCQGVMQAASRLAEKGLVELRQMDGFCGALGALVNLAPSVLDHLLACLAKDVIDEAEVKAVRRQVYLPATKQM